MSIEDFGKFAVEQISRRTADGHLITFWNIGQRVAAGQVKWSDDHSAKSRDEAIALGRRLFR